MPQQVAAIVFVAGILALFWMERERKPRVSSALWLPTLWLALGASQRASAWLGLGPPDVEDPYMEGSPFDRNVLSALLVCALLVLMGRMQRMQAILRSSWPLLLFFGFACLSVLWSDYSFVAFKRWTKAFGNLIMVLVVLTDPEPRAAVKRLLVRVGFLLLPLSLLYIKYYPELGRSYNRWTGMTVYNGVSGTKNGLGISCFIFGLASFWRLVSLYEGKRLSLGSGAAVAHGVVLGIALWLLWLADSATAFGCFLAGAVLILAARRPAFAAGTPLLHLLVLALLLGGVFGLLVAPELGLAGAFGRDETLTGRTQIWAEALSMQASPWLGAGFETFWLGGRLERFAAIYYWRPNQAHNGYLELYLTLGWVGIGLLALVCLWGYGKVMRLLRRDAEMGGLMLAFFVTALLYNLTEAGFKVTHPVWVVFLLAVAAAVTPFAGVPSEGRSQPLTAAPSPAGPRGGREAGGSPRSAWGGGRGRGYSRAAAAEKSHGRAGCERRGRPEPRCYYCSSPLPG
jgi:exopolysaccharide production protein ExoQ